MSVIKGMPTTSLILLQVGHESKEVLGAKLWPERFKKKNITPLEFGSSHENFDVWPRA